MTCEDKYNYIQKVIGSCTRFEQLTYLSDWILHVMKDCDIDYLSNLINYLNYRLMSLDKETE